MHALTHQSDVEGELFRLRVAARIDGRTTACEVMHERVNRGVRVSGFSAFPQTNNFIRKTAESTFSNARLEVNLEILSRDCPPAFFEVCSNAAPFYRTTVVRKMDLLTQAVCGSVMRGFFRAGNYVFVQHPDGYMGYVPRKHLQPATTDLYLLWKNGPTCSFNVPLKLGQYLISPGAKLMFSSNRIRTPNGQWHDFDAASASLQKPAEKARQVLSRANRLMQKQDRHREPASLHRRLLSVIGGGCLPDSLPLLAEIGEMTGYLPGFADLLPGDLLFFMENNAILYDYGIFLGGGNFLHLRNACGIEKLSLLKDEPNYSPRHSITLVFGRRITR